MVELPTEHKLHADVARSRIRGKIGVIRSTLLDLEDIAGRFGLNADDRVDLLLFENSLAQLMTKVR